MKSEAMNFRGSVALDYHSFPVHFKAWVDPDCRLQIEMQPLPAKAFQVLHSAMGAPGSFSKLLVLDGADQDAQVHLSGQVDIRQLNWTEGGAALQVTPLDVKIVTRSEPPAPTPRMRLWFRGFKSFRTPVVEMSLGLVEVRGTSDNVDMDQVCGHLTVQADADVDPETWMVKADEFLTFMHRGLGFVNGGRLQTPLLERVIGDRVEKTCYEGSGHPAGFRPVPFLNQGPIIEALVKRFDDPKPIDDMLWTAVGWLHNDSPYGEGNFLMCMTALECVVEHLIPKTLTKVAPPMIFNQLREKLLQALQETEIDGATRTILEGKIGNLNGRTLSQKLTALRDHHGLPKEVFSDGAIHDAVVTRNDIVHLGEGIGRGEIWPKIMFVRDLLNQIVFREIGYQGFYERYSGGYRFVHPVVDESSPTMSGER